MPRPIAAFTNAFLSVIRVNVYTKPLRLVDTSDSVKITSASLRIVLGFLNGKGQVCMVVC